MKSLPIIFGGGEYLASPLNGYMTAYPYSRSVLSSLYVLPSLVFLLFFRYFLKQADAFVSDIICYVSAIINSKHTVNHEGAVGATSRCAYTAVCVPVI